MSKKEINVFSVSFLDLLSGALGAVLILFIIIPKMTEEQQNALEQLDQLDVQVEQLSELMEQMQNSVPAELYEQIRQKIEEMQQTIEELAHEVRHLQNRVSKLEQENTELRQQLEQTQQQLEQAQQELERLRKEQRKKDGLPSNLADKGEMEVFILWAENVDVDLYVQNMETMETCQHPSRENDRRNTWPWGTLTEDINNTRLGPEGSKYYELFYQVKPVPGRYKVYFNIWDHPNASLENRWSGKPATVTGFVVIYPGKPNEKRIDFPTVTLRQAMVDHVVGTLLVTENDIQLIP